MMFYSFKIQDRYFISFINNFFLKLVDDYRDYFQRIIKEISILIFNNKEFDLEIKIMEYYRGGVSSVF